MAADLALMADDPATQEWWRRTAPCQHPVEEAAPGEWRASMTQVYLME
ncbi:L-rhamnose mutarotase [Streptomyces sp. DSM 40167]